ncbi:hypothetical protein BGX27_008681 [Mortierella sp. AM989]|nr:hypothetical protein BGX27_008681 [Mortierella sp. AM989]
MLSTISQDDIASDFGKRHTRCDKDYDNDRTISDIRDREHSYRSTIGVTELNAENDVTTGRNASQVGRRSSSPSYIERSEPPKSFGYNHDNNNDGKDQKRRSTSIDDKHQHSSDYNGHHWDQRQAQERPTMYHRSTRSSIESQKAQHDKQRHSDQDSQRLQDEDNSEKNSPSRSTSHPDEDREMHDDLMSEDDDQLEDDEYDENDGSSGSRDGVNSKNEDGSESVALTGGDVRKPVKVRSMFVDKLYRMVEDPSIQHLISWAKEGDMFYVYNCIKLSDDVLPKFFKHNNWQSFVRQLNMYGFHKIYRYDREESSLNRKNPETQRWQFYHPHFQRDLPHLRKSIKRKSARNTISAPSTSRIIFEHEHGRGFFLQRYDRSRSNSGEGGHIPVAAQPQNASRVPESKPTPPKLSPGHQHQVIHSSYSHQPPKAGPRPPSSAPNQREPEHRELTIVQHRDPRSPHYQREPEHRELTIVQHRDPRSHQYPYTNQPQDGHKTNLHQRQNTYPSTHSYTPNIHSSDRAHDPNAPRSPTMTHDPNHTRQLPPPSPYLSGGAGTPGYRSVRPNPPSGHYTSTENGPESPHGAAAAAAGHLRSQSVPGIIDHRKASLQSRGSDHGNSPLGYQHDVPQSPGIQSNNANAYAHHHQQHHPTSPHHLQRSHGPAGDAPAAEQSPRGLPPQPPHHLSYNDPHRQDRLPSMGGELVQKDSPQPSTPSLPSGNKLDAPLTPIAPHTPHGLAPAMTSPGRTYFSQANLTPASPTSPRRGDRNSQSVVRDLEARLRAMEDAYMSLQQHTQKLQQAQVSQDRTIVWMRERMDYMTDSIHAHRGPMTSPVIHINKRKAEPLPDDPRSRVRLEPIMPRQDSGLAFGIDGPDQHHAHGHSHSYSRNGPAGPGYPVNEGHPNGSYHEPSPASSGQSQPPHPHNHEAQHPQQQHAHHSLPPHLHQQQMQAHGSHSRQYRKPY